METAPEDSSPGGTVASSGDGEQPGVDEKVAGAETRDQGEAADKGT